jgi:HEAT repeat protein
VLVTLLDNPSVAMRDVSASALGAIGAPEAVERLLIAAETDRFRVRQAATKAIARTGGPSAIESLRALRRRSRNPLLRALIPFYIDKFAGKSGVSAQ